MYDETNKGVLFKNDKKSDKAPDYTGKYNHEGTEFKIAAWIRQSKNGLEFISISKDTYEPPQSEAIAPVPDGEIDLSEIPF